jgi:phosphorylase/glycogen(starch) synthase
MAKENVRKPDYLFEISWEVCNKVGGIHTVISTKALTLVKEHKDQYILIGPDVWMETRKNPEFIEDRYIYRAWRETAEATGLRIRVGRWNVAGKPIVILVDFTQYYSLKDKIFATFWENFQLDSISGQWDYTEPAIFGYAAAKVIESFYDYHNTASDRLIAQFHEWMTGAGLLYLKTATPQIGLAFTTHATVMGRSIAGSGMPLYREMENYHPESLAQSLNITAKFSLEKIAAREADCFTTVSELTARECQAFLGKNVDIVTPNGFEDSFVPTQDEFGPGREKARELLFAVADAVTSSTVPRDSLLSITSGRYEFFNKGIDVYIEALGKINADPQNKNHVLAFIMVPAGHAGHLEHIKQRMAHKQYDHATPGEYLTHALHHPENDPVLNRLRDKGLLNRPEDKVKVIFVPCYLDGMDGIFNTHYYKLLIGFDMSVFASYYEPWGYTPLESLAFHIPTITTTLAGFGLWVKQLYPDGHGCIAVLERDDDNFGAVSDGIAQHIMRCSTIPYENKGEIRHFAWEVSRTALWENLVDYYYQAYYVALEKVEKRHELYRGKQQHDTMSELSRIIHAKPTWKKVLIQPSIPEKLQALKKLSLNLWWSWNIDAQELFASINPVLWEKTSGNPVAIMEMLSLNDYRQLENDEDFIGRLGKIEREFDEYMAQPLSPENDTVAYFSMEYGLHDSLKIFSGGLGVLAGDYLKEASDSAKNIVGVGLLYRYGYFHQSISLLGDQIAGTLPQKFSHLPILPVRDTRCSNAEGEAAWVKVKIAFPGRTLTAKVWRVNVGRVQLYLLDTDIDENAAEDRAITNQLYGGDLDMRFRQEVLLGVGGIRLLDNIGIQPSLYHCNEGHAAFIGMERLRKYVQESKLTFNEALEIVRASTLFTTHTPVPAGHDAFSEDILRTYIPHYPSRLGISWEAFMNLGRKIENDATEKFSMSYLAARISQEMNGVSRIHGHVSQKLFSSLYPGYYPEELHISYVTNGVHFPTWVNPHMYRLYKEQLPPEYINEQNEAGNWQNIQKTDDAVVWGIRNQMRRELIGLLKERLNKEMTVRQESPVNIFKVTGTLNEHALTICFARRFATYKRAHLLFTNLERLSKIVNDPDRPVQFLYAGKAHPNDHAGQEYIKRIYEISKRPEFIGKIIFIENYDMETAKKLVSGADIWLNTPTRPQEASGTSGEKAIMNGTINFSVLDGWWAEGYKPGAGWALKEERTYTDQSIQDVLDAETIYSILEEEIIPTFYRRNKNGIPVEWVSYVKNTISRIAPYFTMKRMTEDYYSRFYNNMFERNRLMVENDYQTAREISHWKQKLIRGWESIEVVNLKMTDSTRNPLMIGECFTAEIELNMHELSGSDIGIEILFGQKTNGEVDHITYKQEMQLQKAEGERVFFYCEIPSNRAGVFDYVFRIYPKNPLLPNRQDFNLIKWI